MILNKPLTTFLLVTLLSIIAIVTTFVIAVKINTVNVTTAPLSAIYDNISAIYDNISAIYDSNIPAVYDNNRTIAAARNNSRSLSDAASIESKFEALIPEVVDDIIENGQKTVFNLTDDDLRLYEEFHVGIFQTGLGYVRGLTSLQLTGGGNVSHRIETPTLKMETHLTVPDLYIEWPRAKCLYFPCTLLLKIRKNLFALTLTLRLGSCEVEHEPKILLLDDMEVTARNVRTPSYLPEATVEGPLKLLSKLLHTDSAKDWIKKAVLNKMTHLRIFQSSEPDVNCEKLAVYLTHKEYGSMEFSTWKI